MDQHRWPNFSRCSHGFYFPVTADGQRRSGAARGVPGELVTHAAPDAGARLPGRFLRHREIAFHAVTRRLGKRERQVQPLTARRPGRSPRPSPRSPQSATLLPPLRGRTGVSASHGASVGVSGTQAGCAQGWKASGSQSCARRPLDARAQTCGKPVACAHCESPRAAPLSRLSDAVRFCVEGTPNSCAARTGRYSERAWKLSTSKFLFCGAIAGYYF